MQGRKRFSIALLSLWGLLAGELAWGGERRVLVDGDGRRSTSYRAHIQDVQPGDTLVVGDREFVVRRVLSDGSQGIDVGSQNLVIATADNKAVRFPLHPRHGERSIQEFLDGYRALSDSQIPMPRVHEAESRPPHFAVMDLEPVQFTLQELLRGTGRTRNLSEQDRARLLERLVPFAGRFWQFETVGDFSFNQVAWAGEERGWLLLDFQGTGTVRAGPGSSANPFDRPSELADYHPLFPKLPDDIRARMDLAIGRARDHHFSGFAQRVVAACREAYRTIRRK